MQKISEKSSEEILKENGFRVTQGKIKILNLLQNTKFPISLKDLHKKLLKDLNRASIYRTLNEFLEKKIIQKINLDVRGNESYFEFIYKKDGHHHHHIVCEDCGMVEELEICAPKIDDKALKSSKYFSSTLHHSLEFFGKCKVCNKK